MLLGWEANPLVGLEPRLEGNDVTVAYNERDRIVAIESRNPQEEPSEPYSDVEVKVKYECTAIPRSIEGFHKFVNEQGVLKGNPEITPAVLMKIMQGLYLDEATKRGWDDIHLAKGVTGCEIWVDNINPKTGEHSRYVAHIPLKAQWDPQRKDEDKASLLFVAYPHLSKIAALQGIDSLRGSELGWQHARVEFMRWYGPAESSRNMVARFDYAMPIDVLLLRKQG